MPVTRRDFSCRSLVLASLLPLALAACAQSEASVSPFSEPERADASALGKDSRLLVMTTRNASGNAEPYFGTDRGALTFAEVRLSPPGRGITGRVSSAVSGDGRCWASRGETSRDAARVFSDAANGRDVLLYVHGFNETFETAARSAGQLSHCARGSRGARLFSPGLPAASSSIMPMTGRARSGRATASCRPCRRSSPTRPWARQYRRAFDGQLPDARGPARIARFRRMLSDRIGSVCSRRPMSTSTPSSRPCRGSARSPAHDGDRRSRRQGARGLLSHRWRRRPRRLGRPLAPGALGVRVADTAGRGWSMLRHDLFLSNSEVTQVVRRAIDRAASDQIGGRPDALLDRRQREIGFDRLDAFQPGHLLFEEALVALDAVGHHAQQIILRAGHEVAFGHLVQPSTAFSNSAMCSWFCWVSRTETKTLNGRP